jgi:hypothetical protein
MIEIGCIAAALAATFFLKETVGARAQVNVPVPAVIAAD